MPSGFGMVITFRGENARDATESRTTRITRIMTGSFLAVGGDSVLWSTVHWRLKGYIVGMQKETSSRRSIASASTNIGGK